MARRLLRRCCLVVALVGLATPASANPRALGAGAPEAAEQRYQIGLQMYRAGRFAEAAREFRVALTMVPDSARLAYNLARSLERSDQLEAAIEHYQLYLRLSPRADDKASVDATIAALQRTLAEQDGTLALTTSPAGAVVTLDGKSLGLTPLSKAVRPGRHTLAVTLAAHAPVEQAVEVKAGETTQLALVLTPDPASAPPPAAMDTTAPDPAPGWRPIAGWSAVGVGVALVGMGVAFNVAANDTVDEAATLRRGDEAEHATLGDDLDQQKALMYVGYGLGAALVAGGVAVLLWPEGDAGEAPAASLSVGPGAVFVGGVF